MDLVFAVASSSLRERGQSIEPADIPGLYNMSGPFGSGEVTTGQILSLFGQLAQNRPPPFPLPSPTRPS